MRLKIFFLWIYGVIFLSGCVDKEILDDVNIEVGAAYDYIDDNRFRGTVLVPEFMPDQKVENVTFSAESTLSRDLHSELQKQTADPLVMGSLEIVLFGNDLAKKGIIDLVDTFQRDPSIGARIYFAVTEGEAKEIFEGDFGTRGNAVYLSRLFEHNMEHRDLPQTNLQLFLSDFYKRGKTAYLPLVKRMDQKKIEINGLSLFKEDRVVDELSMDKMFFFKLMTDQYTEGTFKVELHDHQASVKSITSKHKMKLVNKNPYEIDLKIKIRGEVREFSGTKLNPKELEKIKKNLEKKVNEECSKLIARFKEKDIDPIGFGAFAESRTRKLDIEKWKDNYQKLTVNVRTEVTIIEAGVIE